MTDCNSWPGWLPICLCFAIYLGVTLFVLVQRAEPQIAQTPAAAKTTRLQFFDNLIFSLEVAVPLPQKVSAPGPLVSIHDLRVAKCEVIVRELYPDSGFLPFCDFFVSEYERLNMGEDWQMGLAYCAAGISLRCYYRTREGCAGPCDRPGGSTDPNANIRAHCREWFGFYKRGIVAYKAAKHVFLPRRPHDWRGAKYHRMIWGHYLEHKQVIEQAYRDGQL